MQTLTMTESGKGTGRNDFAERLKSLSPTMDLVAAIADLKREMNAVMLTWLAGS